MSSRTIVAATDFSDRADIALQGAKRTAQLLQADNLHIVHILDTGLGGTPLPYTLGESATEEAQREAMSRAKTRLEEKVKSIDFPCTTEIRSGEPAYEIACAADDQAAELIVVATQGRGAIGRALVGSVASGVIAYAHCPVLITGKDRSEVGFEKILVGVDLSPVSNAVLRTAKGLAEHGSGNMQVFSVFQRPYALPGDHPLYFGPSQRSYEVQVEEDHRKLLADLLGRTFPGETIPHDVQPGQEPDEAVLERVRKEEPDVLVVGSSGIQTWGRRIFGTNAERIVAKSRCPVVVVPDPLRRGVDPDPRRMMAAMGKKRREDEQMVYAMFDAEAEIRQVLADLNDANVPVDDISVLMHEDTHKEQFDTENPDQAFTAGGALGASVGGVLGGLASFGAATGVGLMVVGPAVAMGLAGGLLATLLGFGVSAPEAENLERKIRGGKTMVAVHTHDFEGLQTAKEVFAKHGAQPRRLAL